MSKIFVIQFRDGQRVTVKIQDSVSTIHTAIDWACRERNQILEDVMIARRYE